MQKLAAGLAVLLLNISAALCAEENPIAVTTLLKSSTSWNASMLPAYPAGQPQITITRVVIAPGANLPVHLHHNTIAAGVLLTGELKVVTDDGATLQLVSGDAVIETLDTWHTGQNTGAVPTELLVFYAGVEGQAVSETKP